jgi:hypothetical protein
MLLAVSASNDGTPCSREFRSEIRPADGRLESAVHQPAPGVALCSSALLQRQFNPQ